jgi:hypothetical protein
MFHATGQPVRAQIGGRSRCPWVTAGDRSFPSVLAREWPGAKSGRVPQHTRAERRREAAERHRQRQADQRREERRRKVTLRVVIPTVAASFMFVPLDEANSGHHSSLYLSAAELARADTPDLPHMPERDMTLRHTVIRARHRPHEHADRAGAPGTLGRLGALRFVRAEHLRRLTHGRPILDFE